MASSALEPASAERESGGNPPPLTFGRATFAKLSPRPFLLAHLQPCSPATAIVRPNGRKLDEFRAPTVHTGSLSHAEGSAVVRFGDTAVVCGVKAEILLASDVPGSADGVGAGSGEERPQDVTRTRGLLVPNVELATGCSPAHLPGQPPSPLAQSLAVRILSLLYSSEIVREDLRIWHTTTAASGENTDQTPPQQQEEKEVKAFWTLYIDILFMSLDGNAFDAAWASVVAALSDVRLPKAHWDADLEMVVCDDDPSQARSLSLHGSPMPATFTTFTTSPPGNPSKKNQSRKAKDSNSWILADPDAFEEEHCLESVTVTLDCSARPEEEESRTPKILKLEKVGGGVVDKRHLRRIVQLASQRWEIWQAVLREELKKS